MKKKSTPLVLRLFLRANDFQARAILQLAYF